MNNLNLEKKRLGLSRKQTTDQATKKRELNSIELTYILKNYFYAKLL